MYSEKAVVDRLRKNGNKITKLRLAFIAYFCREHSPISVEELGSHLRFQGLSPNKTSIYRELDFLLENKIIQEVSFGDRKTRYEALSNYHHHHLICKNCQSVSDVACSTNLYEQVREIENGHGFVVTGHLLEFFGVCKSCQKKEEN